ncbi:P-loop containing nucleoside triphosphate hydrolase protein [Tricladium varicosporioides]|nr:P-loop containing nucleoside triphosphate hydrolase protein [Hymenoscyphus varicosporioides]
MTSIVSTESYYESQSPRGDGKDCEYQEKPSWRSLFAFTQREHLGSLILVILFGIIAGFPQPVTAIFYGRIFSDMAKFGAGDATGTETLNSISLWCTALAAIGAATWLVQGIALLAEMIFGELQAKTVRKKTFEGMVDKEIEWYDLRKDGIASLLTRIQTQTREFQLAVSQPLGYFITELSGSILAICVALFYSWRLTLVLFTTIPVTAVLIIWISSKIGPAIDRQKIGLTRALKVANTSFSAIYIVKAFNGQEQEVWKYNTIIKRVAREYLIQARANAFQVGITRFMMIGIFVQGFWYGLYLAQRGLDSGRIVTTFYACLFAIQGVVILLPHWMVIKKGMFAGETIRKIIIQMQNQHKSAIITGTLKPNICEGDIEIKEVTFSYPSNPRQQVLTRSTFFFPAHETTFVIGKSGSGKSTIGNLLLKYYSATSGEILVDSRPIQDLDVVWLRQNITLVQQDSVLFNDTILQNIVFGRSDPVTEKDVLKAMSTADLAQTIKDLPEGLETIVGISGKSLSGGQQQRVALARARLRDTPILILDESTSALDRTSREKVMTEIRKWRERKTTIIITHTVSQIEQKDYVYVMERGVVVQEGYRKSLEVEKHGRFFMFVKAGQPSSVIPEERNTLIARGKRNSEPTSPIISTSEESEGNCLPIATKHQQNYIPTILSFAKPPVNSLIRSPNLLCSNRFSLDVLAAQTNYLHEKEMGSTPPPPSISKFQSQSNRQSVIPNSAASEIKEKNYPFPTDSLLVEIPPSSVSSTRQATQLAFVTQAGLSEINQEGLKSKEKPTLSTINAGITRYDLPKVEKASSHTSSSNGWGPYEGETVSMTAVLKTVWPTLGNFDRLIFILGIITSTVAATEGRKWALSLLGIAIVDGIAFFSSRYASEYVGQAWVNFLRVEALKRILAQPKSWFDEPKNSPGRLAECLDHNAEEMRNLIGRFAAPIYMVLWILAISVTWALTISWKLALVALACTPVMFLVTRTFDHVSSFWESKCNFASESTATILSEVFSNIRVVRAFTLESYFKNKHSKSTSVTYRAGVSRAMYSGLLFGLVETISMFTTSLVFYYGGVMITKGENTVTHVLQVVNLLLFGIANSAAIIALIPQVESSRTTAIHMLYLATLPYPTSHEYQEGTRLETLFPIEFKDCNFTYPSRPGKRSLKGVSLKIKEGICTAIVGPSGSGKSTIATLILALYRPDSSPVTPTTDETPHSFSQLTFSSHPVTSLRIHSLRTQIAIVPQATLLFPTTIYQNIIYGLPEASPYHCRRAAMHAATQAGIHDFIMSLQLGYNTLIGDGGISLSGGQTQRICIARALVRQPKLLILDEATSALDAVSATEIRETITNLMANPRSRKGAGSLTVVIISHSTEMMQIASEVVVIEHGRVVEKGGFEELRRRGGPFARLIGLKKDELGLETKEGW